MPGLCGAGGHVTWCPKATPKAHEAGETPRVRVLALAARRPRRPRGRRAAPGAAGRPSISLFTLIGPLDGGVLSRPLPPLVTIPPLIQPTHCSAGPATAPDPGPDPAPNGHDDIRLPRRLPLLLPLLPLIGMDKRGEMNGAAQKAGGRRIRACCGSSLTPPAGRRGRRPQSPPPLPKALGLGPWLGERD